MYDFYNAAITYLSNGSLLVINLTSFWYESKNVMMNWVSAFR